MKLMKTVIKMHNKIAKKQIWTEKEIKQSSEQICKDSAVKLD